jgi:uncharacterized RDD family membrane protein YckC
VLALGPAYRYVTGGLFFAYIVLFNGPFGKGRTIGKMLLGIAVTDYDGKPASYPQVILRTGIYLPVFFTAPLANAFIGTIDSMMELYIRGLVTSVPLVAMVLANVLVIPFNPFKQGIHDYFAKTLVRMYNPEGGYPDFESLAGVIGADWRRFHRQPQLSGGITFALVFILLAFMTNPWRYEEARESLPLRFAMREVPGFQKADVGGPVERGYYIDMVNSMEGFYLSEDGQGWVKKLLPLDAPTTGTVQLVVEVTRESDWPFDPSAEKNLPYTEQLMELFYGKVLRDSLQRALSNPQIESNKPLRDTLNTWNNSNVELVLIFFKTVRSPLALNEIKRPIASHKMEFEPLRVEPREKVEEEE